MSQILDIVAKKQPFLRVAGGIILAFCCTTPLVWLLTYLLLDGVRALP